MSFSISEKIVLNMIRLDHTLKMQQCPLRMLLCLNGTVMDGLDYNILGIRAHAVIS